MKPLAGLKVIELARILAGPWAGQTLADMGAEVIKIEAPNGDDTRRWGPPFLDNEGEKTAAYFHGCNRGKKSVVVDFNAAEDLRKLRNLISEADVIIENFKVGGLKKYGLDYQSIHKLNPKLVYCSITGFGQTGPYAHRAGYDYIVQGMSGLMSVTGDPDGQPQKVGVAVTDIYTGLYATTAILAAILQRQSTDQGQQIDIALFDVATAAMANQSMNYLSTGISPKKLGNAHPNIVPYQVFECSDGHVILAPGNDGQFQKFCDLLECREIASDARFRTNADRLDHRAELTAILNDLTTKLTKARLLALCEMHGVPAGPINNMQEVFADPQIKHRKLQMDLKGIPSVRSPVFFETDDDDLPQPSPRLGQHQSLLG